MKTIVVNGVSRQDLGSKEAKRLRREGHVPAVIYGADQVIHFEAPERDFHDLIFTPVARIAEIHVDGQVYKCIIKDKQFHPLKDNLLHADFLQLQDDKAISMEVPVRLIGNSIGVRNGGKLRFAVRRATVKALPANLPEAIDVNIEKLRIGQQITIQDLGITTFEVLLPPSTAIVSIKTSRTAVSETEEEGAEEETAVEAAAE
jgi:large subunit ribosomal protein L25